MFLNNVQLKGFLGQDAELKYTGNGKAVTTLSLATKSGYGSGETRKSFTEWHKVVLWGKRAEAATLKKGTYVSVQGEIRSSEYEGKNGKVRTYEIVANRDIELPERPAKSEAAPAAEATQPAADSAPAPEAAEAPAEPVDTPATETATTEAKPTARRKRTPKS
jgi:single-strand DNA-binding protein